MIDRTLTPLRRADRHEPMPIHGWLGERREKALRDGLAILPDLGAQAAVTLTAERLGETGGRGVPGSRPPIQLAAVDLVKPCADASVVGDPIGEADLAYRIGGRKQSIRDGLESWCWLAYDEQLDDGQQPARPGSDLTVADACAWLQRHIVWILDQQWVTELALDVALMVRECRAVLRERPAYTPRCQRDGCVGVLRDEGSGLWRCGTCDHTAGDRARLGLREVVARQQPMTVDQLARAFGWSRETVRSWARRGLLEPVDPDAKPRRFHVIDAQRLADNRGVNVAG